MPSAHENQLRATRRAQDEIAKMLRKGKRPQRSARIPVLVADPPFEAGINLWMDPAGNLRSYGPDGTKYQYAKTAVTAASGSFPADPQPETLTKTYASDWAQSFCDVHGAEPGIWYGDSFDGAHLARKIMFGLPDATIRADLAGASIDKVELTAANVDAAQPQVYLHWGLHNEDTTPGAYSAMRRDAHVDYWPRAGAGAAPWRRVHNAFGEWLRDNQAKGLTIDQPGGPGNSGQLDWTSVRLRITYTV